MSSLAGSLRQFQAERADAVTRNLQHSRPSSTAAAGPGTPLSSGEKRTHDAAFSKPPTPAATARPDGALGSGLMRHVTDAVKYLRDKSPKALPYERVISYINLPNDLKQKEHLVHRALVGNPRITYAASSETQQAQAGGKAADEKSRNKDLFKYRPLHPVTNAEELRAYLATRDTAQGVAVKELKDGWPDCVPALDQLETQGHILVLRNKKDNTPRTVWADSPSYHILSPATHHVTKADPDFVDKWCKIKLPANENDIRNELERAGLTPTSAVKEVRKVEVKKKERKRTERKNGKKTNVHMAGILKDYSKLNPGAK